MTGFVLHLLKDISKLLFILGHPLYLFVLFIVQTLISLSIIWKDIRKQIDHELLKYQKLYNKLFKKPQIRFSIRISLPQKLIIALGTFCIFIGIGTAFVVYIFQDIPDATELKTRQPVVSTKIYDQSGKLLYTVYRDENRTPVSLNEIPLYVQLATIAVEDAEFYNHHGFSPRGITRAIVNYFKTGKQTGGSTITQQLVKNALLSPEKTYTRKIRELYLAIQTERHFSKDEIMEMYLNEIPYGGPAYGIESAAKYYFGKRAQELSLGEAALLAGLTKSPTIFSPFGSHPEYAIGRRDEVLNLMVQNGFISQEIADQTKSQKIVFADNTTNIDAPHFVMYVREQLVSMFGEDLVERGGLIVETTLDNDIQKLAETVVADEVNRLQRLNVNNGAALVVRPTTGEILAMVGSKNYFDTANDGNVNVTLQLRQPGSSIKVINYAYALSHGYTPATVIEDTPTTFNVAGALPYSPRNYDGEYRGRITLRSALAESRNIPAVKILNSYGVQNMITLGQQMGITTWTDPKNYGLSLTLGGGGVKLIDLAQVYSVLANNGVRQNLTAINKVTDQNGKVLYENKQKGIQVLDPRVAYQMTDILKDNDARTPAFGRFSTLYIPNHPEVAVKTGTSNDLRDNLTVGYTKDYVTAVWVGNNDNSQMSRIASGVTGASPIWNNIMSALLSEVPSSDWNAPGGLVNVPICPYTGTLPCSGCPTKQEWFIPGTEPTYSCTPQVADKDKPDTF